MSRKYPTLSCYCPIYKGGVFIEDYMEDLTRQTIFKEVDFFILDCNSPDNEEEVVKRYLGYDNIIYSRLDKDPGLYAAWNQCINLTKGELLTNWNVDDRKSPWSLEVMRDALVLDTEIDLVYGNTVISTTANENWQSLQSAQTFICNQTNKWEDLLLNNNPHCMPMWRRSIHDKYGLFNESYKTAADADMWLRAAKQGSKMKKINETVGVYYQNPQGRSSNPETLQEMINEVNEMRRSHNPSYLSPFEQQQQNEN